MIKIRLTLRKRRSDEEIKFRSNTSSSILLLNCSGEELFIHLDKNNSNTSRLFHSLQLRFAHIFNTHSRLNRQFLKSNLERKKNLPAIGKCFLLNSRCLLVRYEINATLSSSDCKNSILTCFTPHNFLTQFGFFSTRTGEQLRSEINCLKANLNCFLRSHKKFAWHFLIASHGTLSYCLRFHHVLYASCLIQCE